MKHSAIFISTLMMINFSSPAHAWSEETHMTTGAIAFDTLASQNPKLLKDINIIVAAHPNYKQLSAHAGKLKGDAKLRVMMEWMARWPDDIRGTQYSRPEWHTELRVVYGRTWLWPFRNQSALEGLDINYRIFADEKASNKDRAIAMSWLLHIIGDIQQPLHAGHQMTSVFSSTDEAGLLAYVRKPSGELTNLHQYWDRILDVAGPVEATSKKWAMSLQKQWVYGPKTMVTYKGNAQSQFSNWLDESMFLARKVAYKGTYLKAVPEYGDAPTISKPEYKIAYEVSKRRVATGGYRAADTIMMALQ